MKAGSMINSNQTIVFFADHPWQTNMAIQLIGEINSLAPKHKCILILADFYSFLHDPIYVEGIKRESRFEILDFMDLYLQWQRMAVDHKHENFLTYTDWLENFSGTRSLIEVAFTNQLIYSWERSFSYIPINDCCKWQFLSDLSYRIKYIFESYQPNLIVSIERQSLPVNLAQAFAEKNSIKWFSIIQSRVNSRYLIVDEFGLGMSKEKYNNIINSTYSQETTEQVENFIKRILEKRTGSYLTWSKNTFIQNTDTSLSAGQSSSRIRLFALWLITEIKLIYSRHILHPKKMIIKPIIFQESTFRITILNLRIFVMRSLHLFGLYTGFHKKLPDCKFIYWPLHVRPEGSSNVLSLGQDELSLIRKFCEFLPPEIKLVIKENPLMFGQRQRNFYKILKSIDKIYLVDPDFNSINLILGASGVAGVSGTALLEGQLLNKPAIAFGKPEFIEFLEFKGWRDVDKFFCSAQENKSSDNTLMRKYIAYIFENSSNSDIAEFGDLSSKGANEMIKRFAEKIVTKLKTT
jgi:hypothetical protein